MLKKDINILFLFYRLFILYLVQFNSKKCDCMNKILLSIIIPTFRSEKVLNRMITSLEKQSFKDYEIIIINDVIPNEEHTILTTRVIEKLQDKYDNIIRYDMAHTFYQGEARNEGLKLARGKYIAFADSDDWYTEDYFETIVPELEKNDFELLVFNANKMNYDEHIGYIIDKKNNDIFIEDKGFYKLLQGNFAHKIGVVPWNKVFLKELIDKNDVWFENKKKNSEDFLFNLEYITPITKYRYIDKALYNYQLNIDVLRTNEYRNINHEENVRFSNSVRRIANKYNISDYKRYVGLFILRRFPGIVLNETNNPSYLEAKSNVNRYLNEDANKEALTSIKIKDLDEKLFYCFVFYKTRVYRLILYILWKRRHKKNK